jgi:hypothetical protein
MSFFARFCGDTETTLLLTIISELFGLKYYSTLYNFGSMPGKIVLYLLEEKFGNQLVAFGFTVVEDVICTEGGFYKTFQPHLSAYLLPSFWCTRLGDFIEIFGSRHGCLG